MELLIKRVRVVDYKSDFVGDVYIKNGKIAEIGLNIERHGEIIDGKDYVLMPAFVDLHGHFRDPGLTYKEDIESGSRAAVKGGYTTVNLMANTKPVCSSIDTVDYVLEKGKELGLIDIHQCVSITNNLDGRDLSHLDKLREKNEKAKVRFLSDDGKGVADSKVMMEAMLKAKEMGMTIMSHAESPELSDVDMRLAENTMTWRDITLAKYTGCKLHMAHVSTKEAINYVAEAKDSGYSITCEVTPHHLALSDEVDYRVNPPLRSREDIMALIQGINKGYVDAIATDHAPHSSEDKLKGAPGISGIETSFAACYSTLVKGKHITLNKLSELMSKNPSSIMDIKKGKVEIGYEADLVLVDLNRKFTVDSEHFESKGKNSPFNGMKLYGQVVCTIKGGRIVYAQEGLK